MLNSKEIGKRVLQRRHALGLSQEALAAVARVSHETVRRLERGSINPNIITFGKIAEGLQTTVPALLAEKVSDEVLELVVGLPEPEQEIVVVMLRALSDHVASRR